MIRSLKVLAVALALSVAASPARAQTPEQSALTRAKSLYEQANQLLAESSYAEALKLFRESKALVPSQYNAQGEAFCLYKLDRRLEAFRAHRELERRYGSELGDDARKALAIRLAELREGLASLSVTSTSGGVVSVDGESYGKLPLSEPIYLEPGVHDVRVEQRGRTFQRSVSLGSGQSLLVDAVFQTETPKAAAVAATPAPVAGKPDAQREAEPSAQLVAGWVAIGVGAVGVGVGSYFGLRALSKKQESDERRRAGECFQDCRDSWDQAHGAAEISNIAIGAGLLAIAGGVVLWATAPASEPHGIALAWRASPGGGGVNLRSRW